MIIILNLIFLLSDNDTYEFCARDPLNPNSKTNIDVQDQF